MKGILYTITTFLVMLGVVAFIAVTANTNIERSVVTAEQISSQRIYYYWNDIRDNFIDLLNVSVVKKDSTAEVNDTLPAQADIKALVNYFQIFLEDYFEDGTIEIRFEDPDGNEINLADLDRPKISFQPMNINYTWQDYGKNQVDVDSSPENFDYIENITFVVEVNDTFNASYKSNPKVCPCDYCLDFYFTVKNSTDSWTYPFEHLDIDFDNWVAVEVAGEPNVVVIETGNIDPQERVLHIRMVKSGFITNTQLDIVFNTTDFYINYPAILNVTTPYGRKVDYL